MTTDGSAAELAGLLRQLHFSPTAARLYARLVFGGPVAPREARGADEPAVFDASIGELERRRMLARGRDRSGELIYAVDPDLSLTFLVAEVVWSRMADLAPIDRLPATDDVGVEKLRRIAGRAAEIARSAWRPTDGLTGHRSTRAHNAKELAVLAAEAVLHARREVTAVSRRPRLPDVAFFWKAITHRMDEGVVYRRVTDLHELVEHGLRVVERDTRETGVDLRVLETARIDRGFYVIDRRYAIIYDSPNSVDEPPPGGTLTTDRHQIERRRSLYARLYDEAIPADFAVASLRRAGRDLLERARAELDSPTTDWLSELIEFGKFAESAPSEGSARAAMTAGLVGRNYTGDAIPVYGVTERDLRDAWSAHRHGCTS
jgi:hypothetical protein